MSTENIKKLANKLGEAITSSKIFKEYESMKAKYDNDETLQKLIGEFNVEKMNVVEEMGKGNDKDEAKLASHQEKMRELYADIFKNETYNDFNTAKNEVEKLVNEVYGIINFHVTGEDPSCTHDCSTCGGCH